MPYFGVEFPLTALLPLAIIALILFFAPFLFFEWVATMLPAWVQTPFIVLAGYVAFPLLLSYLYRRRQLKFGYGDLWFWIYIGIFCLLGVPVTKLQKVPLDKLSHKQQGTHVWARKALIHMDGSFFRFWSEKREPSGTWKG